MFYLWERARGCASKVCAKERFARYPCARLVREMERSMVAGAESATKIARRSGPPVLEDAACGPSQAKTLSASATLPVDARSPTTQSRGRCHASSFDGTQSERAPAAEPRLGGDCGRPARSARRPRLPKRAAGTWVRPHSLHPPTNPPTNRRSSHKTSSNANLLAQTHSSILLLS